MGSNEEGKKVFGRLMAQYIQVNTHGVTYKLNGKTITERHFDFENTLIKELQTQLDSINAPGAKDWKSIDKQWREGVAPKKGYRCMLLMSTVQISLLSLSLPTAKIIETIL